MAERTVVVTGGAGNIGRKVTAYLDAQGGYDLRLIDRREGDDARLSVADLTRWSSSWTALFRGADAVVHMAGNPAPVATWDQVIEPNIDMVFNVFRAAAESGVRRVIFASSNYAVSGYRFDGRRLTSDLSARPTNPYGATKLFGERLAKGFSESHPGTSFICLRIGFCQRLPGNRPGVHMRHGIWGQHMWLSDRDLGQAIEKSILAEGLTFEVLNIMSDNPGMPWDISAAREKIGFEPLDGVAATSTPLLIFRNRWQRMIDKAYGGLDRIFWGAR